jgi:hypothetical protein
LVDILISPCRSREAQKFCSLANPCTIRGINDIIEVADESQRRNTWTAAMVEKLLSLRIDDFREEFGFRVGPVRKEDKKISLQVWEILP